MDLLDHLWDDTVAGPRPENGLVKLRKHPTFPNSPSISAKEAEGGNVRSYGGGTAEEGMRVTRSIMIVKPAGYQSQSGSAPASPAGSTPPVSPFSGKEVERGSVLEEGQHQVRMRTRRQAKTDEALLLLSMCDKLTYFTFTCVLTFEFLFVYRGRLMRVSMCAFFVCFLLQ
ncbi:dormancy-associated protein homolog 3-like isoform X1 [Cicer arietinum]|uniref:Uncharacterized protein LOC101493302 isoform X1 n=1 Tax=Cicer arietinum TaxID=3827 RepID=A0A3Q7XP42_CICAR|nr:uncharacterized protein LOC101493302 isoform X1 [Cicer arietinum]